MKNIFIKTLIFIVAFLFLDFFFGNLFFKSHFNNKVYEYNDQFLYNFKKNLNVINYNYGNLNYALCTNNLGSIDKCNNEVVTTKKFDYVFIGDSFVEGLGIEFNDTFFGQLKKKYFNKKLLNLGVSGYSSSIYYNKLKYFYKNGYLFSEIFIFLDTSDIFDEIYRYKETSNGKISFNLNNDQINDLLDGKKKIVKNFHRKFPGTFFLISLIIDILPNFKILDNYYLQLMINHTFGKWSYGNSDIYTLENVNRSLIINSSNIDKIINLVNQNNTKVTFVLYPWPGHLFYENIDNKYNTYWTNFFKEKNINVINLNDDFYEKLKLNGSKKTILEYYILGDVHFNKKGHKIIYKNLDNFISKK